MQHGCGRAHPGFDCCLEGCRVHPDARLIFSSSYVCHMPVAIMVRDHVACLNTYRNSVNKAEWLILAVRRGAR
eukprot:2959600-Pleurochrysis_carterae.AAC.1